MISFQNIISKNTFILFVSVLMTLSVKAQQEEDKRPVTIDSFDVVRDYKPLLADAVKIRRSPDMTNKRSYMPRLSYNNIMDQKLNINTGLKELDVREIPFAVRHDILSNYVKLGIGNFNTILGEAFLAVEDYEDIRFGGFIKHLGQKGSIEDQKFSSQEIGIFGRRVLPLFTVDGLVGFNRYATNFYGMPLTQNDLPLNTEREAQAFNDIYFTGELTSNYNPDDEEAISYSAKLDGYSYKDKFAAKESSVAISGYINKRVRAFNIGANLGVDINSMDGVRNAQGETKMNNSLALLNPYIRFKGDNYVVTLGANLVPEFGDSTSFNIFPSAEVDFSIVPEYLHLFGGIDGNVRKASYRELSRENPYLGPGQTLRNTVERMSFYGGIKGNMGATFGYKAKVFYKNIEGLPMYSVNKDRPYQFDIIYDGDGDKAVKHMGLEGEVNVRLSEVVNLGARLNFEEYTMAYEEEAWHLPKLKLAATARFNVSEKLYIDAEALFHNETYAKTYEYADINTAIEPYRRESVPAFFDLSAGAEYKATKQLGIFVKANNILNTEYQRYIYYPKLGFNFLGGLNFSF